MILVTGATGFIGSAVVRRLARSDDDQVVAAVRRAGGTMPEGVRVVEGGELSPATNWEPLLRNVQTVVHAAARVHVMRERSSDPLAEFRRTNVDGTLNLARQAAAAGAQRFIFVSSIKVNGEATRPEAPFRPDDIPAPLDPYGVSKLEAEQALRDLARQSGMGVTIIRPPLVYGPGVKANFHAMMRWLWRGMPLPLGSIHNRRSLVALDNLVDLVVVCCHHPAALNQTFLVSDGEDLSTTELLRRIAAALGRPARLIPVPARALELAAAVLGKAAVARRLLGSLQVDISSTRRLLDWKPPLSLAEGLQQAATWFRESR